MGKKKEKKSAEKIGLSIEGDMTIYRAASLGEDIAKALDSGGDVEIDLSRVSEIDGAGLQLMLAAKRESKERGIALSFVGHSPVVREVLDLCNLGEHFGDPVVIH